jgi:tetratricopeptide (TPR) repeat protein
MEIGQNEVDITRREVEAKLSTVGDYVKMDFLQQCLKKQIDFDTRKFVLTKLASIYEDRKMFLEAARLWRASADINTTYEGKKNDFIKSTELYINGGNYVEADVSFQKALACVTEKNRPPLRAKIKEHYKIKAREMISRDKRKNAMEIYEHLNGMVGMDLDPVEKKELQSKLLDLYNKLGKIREYSALQRAIQLGSAEPAPSKAPPAPRRSVSSASADDLLMFD